MDTEDCVTFSFFNIVLL